jgi:hypothetical protein
MRSARLLGAWLPDLSPPSTRGVQVDAKEDRFLVRSMSMSDVETDTLLAVDLPRLPAALVENGVKFLRDIWDKGECCASWLLYLHPQRLAWRRFLPSQVCTPVGANVYLSFPGCRPPSRSLCLAGSITSCPTDGVGELVDHLPVFDGVHLFWHPDNWMRLTCFVIAGGVPYPTPATDLLIDRQPADPRLLERIWFADTV